MNLGKCVILILLLNCFTTAQNCVTLKPSATVSGTVIRLRDVATVSGTGKAALDTLEVGRIVAPGTARFVLRDELFLFTKLPDAIRKTVTLSGEPRCRVTMDFRDLKISEIAAELREKILNELSWDRNRCTISFTGDPMASLARVGKGTVQVRVGELHSKTIRGKCLIPVVIDQGDYKERITVPALIEVTGDVFVANRRIELGETVTFADFSRQSMDLTFLPSVPVTKMIPGESYKIKGGIVPDGAILLANRIEKRDLIETGQTIALVAKVGVASLTITGIARESGNIGDRIAVENSTSKKIIRGIIIEPGVVRVDQGGGS